MQLHLQGGRLGILTNSQNQNAKIERIYIDRIKKEFEKGNIVLVTGFQGIDANENITTLGRGGSDTTAVAIASALNAKHCYIFSDVDGIYSTDPNKIKTAKKLTNLSYDEMFEIADEGAKVLHNRCIEIGERFKVPIIAKSTFNNADGSIVKKQIEYAGVKSIVKNDNLIYITINNQSSKLLSSLYNNLISNDIWPKHVIDDSNIKFLINAKQLLKLQTLLEKTIPDLKISYNKVSRISFVGYGMTNTAHIFNTINRIITENKLSIYSLDTSQTKIGIVFKNVLDDNILEIFHRELIE